MGKYFSILFILFSFSLSIQAQSTTKSIISDLNMPKAGEGTIRIMQDETIQNKIGVYSSSSTVILPQTTDSGEDTNTPVWDPNRDYVKVRGYKIQVFSGNNQNQSKQEADTKERLVRESFPMYETVKVFQSPFWRVRTGNFITREEAEAVLKEMRHAFPSFGKEMTIVKDVVKRSK